jgi:type IV pilus assembly protein PilW
MTPRMTTRRDAQRGMSLVELMVGMLIGLIGVVIISHLYITNEQYKRSTTGSGAAQVNGAIALYTLERDLRMAGFGVNHSQALGCSCGTAGCSPVQYHFGGTYSFPPAGSATGARPALKFAPVLITETTGQPDTITVLYGSNSVRILPSTLSTAGTPASDYSLDGVAGFDANDMALLANGSSCMLFQVTAVSALSSSLTHASTSSWNPAGGGSLPTFAQGSYVFNIGTPTWRTYSIASGRLQMAEVLTTTVTGGAATTIMDDIVDLQAEYGKDDGVAGGTADDSQVDSWDTTEPSGAAAWGRVLAVRIAVLARSPNYEKPSSGTTCEATTTTNQPTWSGGQTFPTLQVTGALPSCYKYRVFETIIPLRNMLWRPA